MASRAQCMAFCGKMFYTFRMPRAKTPAAPSVFIKGLNFDAHVQRMAEGIASHGLSIQPAWWVHSDAHMISRRLLLETRTTGMICFSISPEDVRLMRQLAIPIVKVSSITDKPGLHQVVPDNRAIGVLAASHFQEMLYRDFAFYGIAQHGYSNQRQKGYCEALAPYPVRIFNIERSEPSLKAFMASLPKPCAVFCANDHYAGGFIHFARKFGYRVPEDFAVLGVDNDSLRMMSSPVPFSSIDPNSFEIGRRAAERLGRLMRGEADDGETQCVPPKGIILRASTDRIGSGDPLLAKAMQLIRKEACLGLDVRTLCKRVGIGRRRLERMMQEVAGRGPGEEIRNTRILAAKKMLAETPLGIGEIAVRVGFEDPLVFSRSFRNVAGQCPSAWRKEARRGQNAWGGGTPL
jgi:LacI family transcriptional regulator